MEDDDLQERVRDLIRERRIQEPINIGSLWNTTQVEARSTLWQTFFDQDTGLVHFTGYVTEDAMKVLRVMRKFAKQKENIGGTE